jgi:uncharacterized protein
MEGFDIEFVKLKNGIHTFQYEIGKPFFDFFQNSEIQGAKMMFTATLNKNDTTMVVDLHGTGTLDFHCDRCLKVHAYQVIPEFKILYHLNSIDNIKNEGVELNVDVFYLTSSTFKVNISESIYESFLPVIPMVKKCEDIPGLECDPDIIDWLDSEKNTQGEQTDTDPRWDALKNLLNKKEK